MVGDLRLFLATLIVALCIASPSAATVNSVDDVCDPEPMQLIESIATGYVIASPSIENRTLVIEVSRGGDWRGILTSMLRTMQSASVGGVNSRQNSDRACKLWLKRRRYCCVTPGSETLRSNDGQRGQEASTNALQTDRYSQNGSSAADARREVGIVLHHDGTSALGPCSFSPR